MCVVNGFMIYTLKNRWYLSGCRKYGPLILTMVAVPFIMADLSRHVLNDLNVWQWCGDNTDFPRINASWTDSCLWSSTQFTCNVPCCVPLSELDTSLPSLAHQDYPQLDDSQLQLISDAMKQAKDTDSPLCNCNYCVPGNQEDMAHLSMIGILFTACCTYFGFILLAVGTLWNANIIDKLKAIREQWRELRGSSAAYAPATSST